jgi:peptidase M23-like protein
MRTALTCLLISLAAPVAAGDIVLSLPIDCDLGQNCHVQHYVDRDPSLKILDFHCGDLSYEGHKGTDFALSTIADMQRGVNVLAAADGQVRGMRDGVADVIYGPDNAAGTDGRECGNGVVIRHADDWETQYCHMKSGSITVKSGDQVKRGDVLGQVGLSGKTQFPHVHLSVRNDGKVIDPFVPDMSQSCGQADTNLWDQDLPYTAGGLINAGFSDGIPSFEAVKGGTAAQTELAPDAKGLVLFAYAYGGRSGDIINLKIVGPKGQMLDSNVELDKDQAQLFRATGRRLKANRWPAGNYTGTVRMIRGGTELAQQQVQMHID